MNSPKFKLEFQEQSYGHKNYIIVHRFEAVGEITFKIKKGVLHIYNVFIHTEFKGLVGFGDWLRTFETICVYSVLPEAIAYWQRRKADIISTVERPRFSDIIFDEEDFSGNC